MPSRRTADRSVLDPPGADHGVVAVGEVLVRPRRELHLLHVATPVAQDPAQLRGAVLPGERTGVQVDLQNEAHGLILAGAATICVAAAAVVARAPAPARAGCAPTPPARRRCPPGQRPRPEGPADGARRAAPGR